MKLEEKIAKVDKTFADLQKFVDDGEYEYGAMLVRTIVEIIVNSYTDYYTPGIKAQGVVPDLLTQINELDKCSSFPHAQIYNLHSMRKMSNKGSHQGTEETVSAVEIRGLIPTIESEIRAWKSFAKEGHESLREIARQREEIYRNGEVVLNPEKAKKTLRITIFSLGVVLFLSIGQTFQFFKMGLHYGMVGLPIYWGCVLAFFILAAYFRHYGKVHKMIYDAFALYFVAPRIYQVILCFMGKGSLGEKMIYLAFVVAIIGGYSIVAMSVRQKKGGIVGYQ